MKKLLFLILSLILTACASSATVPTSTPTPPLIIAKTSTPVPPVCKARPSLPTPDAAVDSLFRPVDDEDMTRGPKNAAVIFILYADFQDAPSANLAAVLAQLQEKYPDDLQIVFRDFPMVMNPGHEKAGFAAHAAHAANLQGKFWEMHDLLYAQQEIWAPLTEASFIDWLAEESEKIGIDSEKLLADMQSDEIVEKVRQAFIEGTEIGIPFTPFFLINGQIEENLFDFYSLDRVIPLILLGEKQFSICPPLLIDSEKEYLATLKTEKGDIVIQFYPQEAPVAVNNFIFLAKEGWFDRNTFQRVLHTAYAETGDPSGTGQGNPGYFFEQEISPNLSFDRPGVVAMKNFGSGANGSQFFITYAPLPEFDGVYTIFGQVLSGFDVLEQLTPRDPLLGEVLPAGDLLLSVTIEER